MRAARSLILLALALFAIGARAQANPAAPDNQQQNPLAFLGGLPGFDLSALLPQQQAGANPMGDGLDKIHGAGKQALSGLAQAGQGIAQAGIGAVQAVGKGVQNVAGQVTDRVSDGFQSAADTAKLVGGAVGALNGAVAQGIRDIPQDIRNQLADARDNLSEDYKTMQAAAAAFGQFAQAAAPVVPPLTKAWDPNAWKQSYSQYGTQFNNAYGGLSATFESLTEGISAKYCTEAKYTPSVKKPAKFTGSGFSITFLTGACEFDEEALFFNKTKQINCIKPAVVYARTPATFTSKYKSAPKFVTKECIISKTFGEELTKVLYVFDGSETSSITNLTNRITSEMRDVLGGARAGTAAIAGQLQSFLGGLPQLPGVLGHKGHGLPDHLSNLIGSLPGFGGQSPSAQAQAQVATPPVTPATGAGAYTAGPGPNADAYAALKQALSTYPSLASA